MQKGNNRRAVWNCQLPAFHRDGFLLRLKTVLIKVTITT
jgi:hypothetical protein